MTPEEIKLEDEKLLNLVAFCLLMENGEGVLGKSPGYIVEKFNRYCGARGDEYKWGLDSDNSVKLMKWRNIWLNRRDSDSPQSEKLEPTI